MALELQLSTDKAQRSLDQIERSLDSLRLSLDKVATGTSGFDSFTATLSNFKGINPAALTSIKELGAAAASIGKGGTGLTSLSNAMSKLANMDVSKVAASFERLVAAMSQIKIPAGLDQLAVSLDRISKASAAAGTNLKALNAIKINISGLKDAAADFDKLGGAAKRGGSAVSMFGSVASNIRGGLAALGIAAIGRELGQFVKDSYEATAAMAKFNAIVNNVAGAGAGAKAMDFLRSVARESAIDIRALSESFPRYLQALHSAGATSGQVTDSFRKLAVAFRGLGLSGEETEGAFKAVIQMFQKGKVSAEELRGQLGDRGVPAVTAFAKALGVTTAELDKMMEQGKLSSSQVLAFIDTLHSMSAGAVNAQLATIGAQMTLLNNAFYDLKISFGKGFFDSLAAGMQTLTAAMNSAPVQALAQAFGVLLGIIAGPVVYAFGLLVQTVATALYPISTLINFLYQLYQAFASTAVGQFMSQWMSLSTVVNAFTFVVVAVVTAVEQLHSWMMNLNFSATTLGTSLQWVGTIFSYVGAVINKVVEAFTRALNAIKEWVNSIEWLRNIIEETQRRMSGLAGTADETARSFDNITQKAFEANNGIQNMGVQSADTANKVKQLAANNREAADTFDKLAQKTETAAAATEGLAAAQQSLNSAREQSRSLYSDMPAGGNPFDSTMSQRYFGGDHIWSSDSWSGGGIVSRGSPRSKDVPLSAFANAPRFAQGGTTTGMTGSLPDGGIPSILHPNEAVVPLDAGGRIPVSQSGGNGQQIISALSREFGRQNGILQEMNKGIATTHENVDNAATVIKTEADRILAELQTHQRLLGELGKGMGKVVSAVETAMTRLSSGGGYSGGGSSYSGGGGSVSATPGAGGSFKHFRGGMAMPGTKEYEEYIREYGINPSGSRGRFGGGTTGTMEGTESGTKGMASSSGIVTFGQSAAKMSGFATGSPNAFKDIMRGTAAPAAIHKNEAIIPLPDGRSVPVTVSPDSMTMPHRPQPTREGRGFTPERSQSGSRTAPSVNVTMHITTPDARSFRQSEDQTVQRLVQRIQRATQNLGTPGYADDPTRPPARAK